MPKNVPNFWKRVQDCIGRNRPFRSWIKPFGREEASTPYYHHQPYQAGTSKHSRECKFFPIKIIFAFKRKASTASCKDNAILMAQR